MWWVKAVTLLRESVLEWIASTSLCGLNYSLDGSELSWLILSLKKAFRSYKIYPVLRGEMEVGKLQV